MSFLSETKGVSYAPGWFLSSEINAIKKTRQISQSKATTAENGAKYVPCGTIYPANDATAIGIVYEDVDVTTGDMPGSIVTSGEVYTERLPEKLNDAAKTALEKLGFKFVSEPAAPVRP